MVIEWDGYSLARPGWVAADVERWRKEHRGCPERMGGRHTERELEDARAFIAEEAERGAQERP